MQTSVNSFGTPLSVGFPQSYGVGKVPKKTWLSFDSFIKKSELLKATSLKCKLMQIQRASGVVY